MINDQFSPEEEAIIQQIQTVPRLELGSAARDAIRGRMLDEFRVVSQQSAVNAAAQTRLVFLTVTALIVVTIIVIIVAVIVGSQNTDSQPTATPLVLSASPQLTAEPTLTGEIVSPTIATQVTLSVSETIASQTPVSASSTESVDSVLPSPTIDLAITPSAAAVSVAIPEGSASETQSPESSATPTLGAVIVIEGPVINIVNNIITIYDFEIEVEANHPILNLIEIGDLVRIEGAYGSGSVLVATVVSNLSSAPLVNGATVSLDGPVESINGNIIVVNGIAVQLGDNDPLLQTVQVGQFVNVQGNFQGSGTTIVLVVVNIVVNANVTVTDNDCWYHESGMSGMGHWHCDGQGMGMGMGNSGMGMGMGN